MQGTLSGNTHQENFRSANRQILQELEMGIKNTDIFHQLSPIPTEVLALGLNFLLTPPISTYQPTQF